MNKVKKMIELVRQITKQKNIAWKFNSILDICMETERTNEDPTNLSISSLNPSTLQILNKILDG